MSSTAKQNHDYIGSNELKISLEHVLKDTTGELVIILGQFGVGKTTKLNEVISSLERERYCSKTFSFFGIEDLHSAYLTLIPPSLRLLLIILSAVFYLLMVELISHILSFFDSKVSSSEIFSVAILAFFFLMFSNKIENTYRFFSYLFQVSWTMFGCIFQKRKIIVLEDLDRSGLTLKEQWSFLRSIKGNKYRQHICTVGYQTREEKIIALENILKIKAKVITIEIDQALNLQILEKLFPWTPFRKEGVWLGHFTPRELIDLAISAKHEGIIYEISPTICLIEKIILGLLEKLTDMNKTALSYRKFPNDSPQVGLKFSENEFPLFPPAATSVFYSLKKELLDEIRTTDEGSIREALLFGNLNYQKNIHTAWTGKNLI